MSTMTLPIKKTHPTTSSSNQPMNSPTLPRNYPPLPTMPKHQANFDMNNMSHLSMPMTKVSSPLPDTNLDSKQTSKAMDDTKLDMRQTHTNMYQTNLPFSPSCPPQNHSTLSENTTNQLKDLPSKPSPKLTINPTNKPSPMLASNLNVPRSPRTPPGFPELELQPHVDDLQTSSTTTSSWDVFPFKSYPRDEDADSDQIYSDDYENPDDFLKKLYEKYKIKWQINWKLVIINWFIDFSNLISKRNISPY